MTKLERKLIDNQPVVMVPRRVEGGTVPPNEFERVREQTVLLTSLVAKVCAFSDDRNDEFQVVRENGEAQGIFKTWAVPVIPFLENGNGEQLVEHIKLGPSDFWKDMNPKMEETMEVWSGQLRENPTKLWQTLERWRGFCDIHDKRLHEIYSSRELPDDRVDRVAELYWRLKIAFAYSSPFYHFESVIGGGDNIPHSPIELGNGSDERGGALDVVGISMPSALKGKVVASELDWNGLSWESIAKMAAGDMHEDEELKLATRIARKVGVDVKDVLFAANALEWIPASVGGKKDDLELSNAQRLTARALGENTAITGSSVARDMNALIRFYNWFPLVRGEENFTSGEGWRYAAICDTANLLLSEVKMGGVFTEDFDRVFADTLSDQVSQLDANSAKGRFLMELVDEGQFKGEYAEAIAER